MNENFKGIIEYLFQNIVTFLRDILLVRSFCCSLFMGMSSNVFHYFMFKSRINIVYLTCSFDLSKPYQSRHQKYVLYSCFYLEKVTCKSLICSLKKSMSKSKIHYFEDSGCQVVKVSLIQTVVCSSPT